jgi:hypothetical protein
VTGRSGPGRHQGPQSQRTLALPCTCVEALREHRVRQAQDRLSAGLLSRDHGLGVCLGGRDADR